MPDRDAPDRLASAEADRPVAQREVARADRDAQARPHGDEADELAARRCRFERLARQRVDHPVDPRRLAFEREQVARAGAGVLAPVDQPAPAAGAVGGREVDRPDRVVGGEHAFDVPHVVRVEVAARLELVDRSVVRAVQDEAAPDQVVKEPPARRIRRCSRRPRRRASRRSARRTPSSCADDVGERDRDGAARGSLVGEHLDAEALCEERRVLEDVAPGHARAAQRLDADELGQRAAGELRPARCGSRRTTRGEARTARTRRRSASRAAKSASSRRQSRNTTRVELRVAEAGEVGAAVGENDVVPGRFGQLDAGQPAEVELDAAERAAEEALCSRSRRSRCRASTASSSAVRRLSVGIEVRRMRGFGRQVSDTSGV